MNEDSKMKQTPTWARTSAHRAILFAAIPLLLLAASCRRADQVAEVQTFEVRSGPLTISVTQSGTITPRDREVIKNAVEGTTTILSLVAEGTHVKKDELLVELDSKNLKEQKFDRELELQAAEADFIRARETQAITESEGQSEIEKAELALTFAKQDHTKYLEGEYPQALKEAEAKITLSEEEVGRAREQLKWSRVLFEEKYISQTELQSDELAVQKAELDLDVARGSLKLLKDYTYKRTVAELTSDIKQNEMALERARRKATANNVQAKAELTAKESEFKRQQEKLDELEDQIDGTKIYAPRAGEVIYATSVGRRHHWRDRDEPLAEGSEVRERQELIYLPSTDRMMSAVKIHESNLKKIKPGMPVRVTLDALPGRVFHGTVHRIAPLPDTTSSWFNPDLKVFDTQIHIESSDGELRSGMSCTTEIIVDHYKDAVYVPIQCVVRSGTNMVAFVNEDGTVKERKVAIGLDNNRMIHVTSGLAAGERVLLAPPLKQAERESAEPASAADTAPGMVNRRQPSGAHGKGAAGQPSGGSRSPRMKKPGGAKGRPTGNAPKE